jgi:hypothetical protein
MNIIARMLARTAAGRVLGELAQVASLRNLSLDGWRGLVARAARAGDLDAIYEVYVRPVQLRAQRLIDSKEK